MTEQLSPRDELKRLRAELDKLHAQRLHLWDDHLRERYLIKRIKELEDELPQETPDG